MENNKKIKIRLLIFLVPVLMLCACSKNRMPTKELDMPTEELANGRVLYNNYCDTCHPRGMAGLGPAIINKPLPKFLMRFQVRHGLGVMPDFDEDVLKDEEVKNIAEYIVYLRKNR